MFHGETILVTQAAKRILPYLNGTRDHGLFYTYSNAYNLVGYTDSYWADDIETRRSTSGYVFYLGNEVISWSFKKQQVMALSIPEAEYIVAASTT